MSDSKEVNDSKLEQQEDKQQEQQQEPQQTTNTNTTTAATTGEETISPQHAEISEEKQQDDSNVLPVTLLLINSQRVAINIDHAYLSRHAIPSTNTSGGSKATASSKTIAQLNDPQQLPVDMFKKCIYSDWQETWGTSPANPANIRLIHLGKILEDDKNLAHYGITLDSKHNVVHCSIKPESFEIESTPKKKKSAFRSRRPTGDGENTEEERDRSRCCIIS